MTNKFSTLALCCLLAACNSNTATDTKNNTDTVVNKDATKANSLACYRYIKDKDTVVLKTIDVGSSITGTLVYNFYEKDKNAGTIQGKMNGDLLIVDYTFFSEGSKSVRQVAFKKVNGDFTEGYGDAEEKDGKMVFKNIAALNFDKPILLKNIDCEK